MSLHDTSTASERRKDQWRARAILTMSFGLCALLFLSACITLDRAPEPVVALKAEPDATPSYELSVMTLNLAHGRGTGLHQSLQNGRKARRNLDEVAALLLREQPDLVALQEADGPSSWSGRFDHVTYVGAAGGLAWSARSGHANGNLLDYGTALLGSLPLEDARAHTFMPGIATTPKGFTVVTATWPGTDLDFDVISVHLEALRTEIRKRQVGELVRAFADSPRPIILMGDFNATWDGRDEVMATITEALDLRAWQPEDSDGTYRNTNLRIDWILVSEDFEFVEHRTLDDAVSDHRPVMARLRLSNPALAQSLMTDPSAPASP